MFNLEKAIANWRQQIIAAGLKKGEAIDELEDHLRNEFQQQIQAGLSAQRAFQSAVERIGGTQALKAEFAKLSRRTGFLGMLKDLLMGTRAPLIAFTPEAQQSLERARAEAPRLNHNFIGTEHVLLGLLNAQSGILSNVMRRLGVESAAVRAEIEKVIRPGPPAKRIAAEIPYTPRANRAFALAAREARMLRQGQVNSEHIFLGLIKENGGVAGMALRNLGVNINRARDEVVKEMNLRKGAG